MDAISRAARNVSILLNRKLKVPPVPLKSVRKQENTNVQDAQSPYQFLEPVNVVKVYEIWKVYLKENKDHLDEIFVVLDADYKLQGYRNGKWSNVEYKGFYTTIEEAQNQISGYLE
jgi:hypothetical protein